MSKQRGKTMRHLLIGWTTARRDVRAIDMYLYNKCITADSVHFLQTESQKIKDNCKVNNIIYIQ